MTPTPWNISPVRTTEDTAMIVGGSGFEFGLIADVTEDDDAAFIIKAVNNHDSLIAALEEIEDLGANGETAARLGNIAHAALIAIRHPVGALPPRAPSSQPAESAGAKTGGGK